MARSEKHAKWGLISGGMIAPLVLTFFFATGLLLYVYYQKNVEAGLLGTIEIKNIFGHFFAHHFPNGLKDLAIMGILAAAMSTIDTGINK